MWCPGQEPGRAAVPGAARARLGDGATAQWEVQAARGQVNGAAHGRGPPTDRRGPEKAVAKLGGNAEHKCV
jgi:hypothetical protein